MAIPMVRGRFEQFRLTNQVTLRETETTLELFQVLVDVYTREVLGALLGVYINVSRIGKHLQQVSESSQIVRL